MRKVDDLKPGDQVIMFPPSGIPVLAWVCHEVYARSIYPPSDFNKAAEVKVTKHEDERDAGKGTFIAATHIQPYSDELWAGCEKWLQNQADLSVDLAQLKKGKIPYDDKAKTGSK